MEKTLKKVINFLRCHHSPRFWNESDRWFLPDFSVEDVDWFESIAVGYVAAYIIREILPNIRDCTVCKQNLLHEGAPKAFYHKLVQARGYSDNVQRLI